MRQPIELSIPFSLPKSINKYQENKRQQVFKRRRGPRQCRVGLFPEHSRPKGTLVKGSCPNIRLFKKLHKGLMSH